MPHLGQTTNVRYDNYKVQQTDGYESIYIKQWDAYARIVMYDADLAKSLPVYLVSFVEASSAGFTSGVPGVDVAWG